MAQHFKRNFQLSISRRITPKLDMWNQIYIIFLKSRLVIPRKIGQKENQQIYVSLSLCKIFIFQGFCYNVTVIIVCSIKINLNHYSPHCQLQVEVQFVQVCRSQVAGWCPPTSIQDHLHQCLYKEHKVSSTVMFMSNAAFEVKIPLLKTKK